MYELLVLSLLMHWPLHAYRIAKIANQIIGPEDQISTGTLSTLLNKLVQAGLIAPADTGTSPFPTDRPSRIFTITAAGRAHFIELMMDTTTHSSFYRRLFHIKALHLQFLPLERQLFLVDSYIAYCQQFLHAKHADKQDVSDNPLKQEHMSTSFREAAMTLMQFKMEQWRLELAWAEALRKRVLSQLTQHEHAAIQSNEDLS